MRENLSKLRDRLDRLESACERRRSSLSELEEMKVLARSNSYLEPVAAWITEIEGKIEQAKGWTLKTEAKLQ